MRRRSVLRATAEPLERRALLSVSAATLAGPINVVGTHWEYAAVDDQGSTNTLIETAAGPTTFNGNACDQIDVGPTGASHTYEGFDGAGDLLAYGGFIQFPKGNTQTDTFAPATSIPAQLEAGTPYTSSYTDNETDVDPTGTTTSAEADSVTTTLVSDTTSPIVVPAGTYDAYEVRSADTTVTPDGDGTSTTNTTTTDEWVVPDVGYVKATEYGSDGSIEATFSLSVFKNVDSKLRFRQPPLDAGVGATIRPPVTVEIDDAAGNVQTGASGSVTVAVVPAAGATGKLGGTLTEPLVSGVATFGDLSVDAGGDYALTATDASPSPATAASSASFTVTDGTLVFVKKPHDGSAGQKLAPGVIVELHDAKGKVITSEDGAVVTLATIGVTGGAALTGNTATLSGGRASYPALVFKAPGSYTLQASDAAGDAQASSDRFKITGDHLAFDKQPANVDVGQPVTFTMSLRDAKNKIDTGDNTDQVSVALNLPTGTDANLAGTTTLTLTDGVATFTAAQGLKIDQPGNYTLTVTPLDSGGVALAGASAVTSKTFSVGPYHLVLTQKPASTVGVGEPIPFVVKAYDRHNKPYTDLNDGFAVANAIPSAAGSLKGATNFTRPFVNGVATFAAPDPTLSTPDTYRVVIYPQDALGHGLAAVTGTAQCSVKVQADHVVFLTQPTTLRVGGEAAVTVTIAIKDFKNKVTTAFDGDEAYIDVRFIGDPPHDNYTSGPEFSGGTATFSGTLVTASIVGETSLPAGYDSPFELVVSVLTPPPGGVVSSIEDGTSRVFRITAP